MTADRSRCFKASAPARIDFAGGWTDVAPFASREGGVVVNAAIELRARVQVHPGGDRYLLDAADLGETAELGGEEPLRKSGHLDLLKAALRRSGTAPCLLRTQSEAPAGSGLGGSGALDVALVAALDLTKGARRSPMELAEEAFQLEAVEAELPGGRQDQYAAALGGFHRLGFGDGSATADRLRLDPEFASELARRLIVCYTGVSRVSSRMIARVMDGYARGDARIVRALQAMTEVAERMAEALRTCDLPAVGRLLSENWRLQEQLDPGMRTEPMVRLEAAMDAAGILGGKAVGAGAGGSMVFLAAGNVGETAVAARRAGAQVLPFVWASEGVQLG